MEFDLQPGKYVVAVSGGVDSVVLLHLLMQMQDGEESSSFTLVVAHFDHGIRADSAEDRKLVQSLAEKYGLSFEYAEGKLGPNASEAKAREARYAFLHVVREKHGADAIVTAHHQDDMLETVILNLLRGTNRHGLTSLKSTDVIKRPLLGVPKNELLRYAKRAGLQWHEDSTNTDTTYLRNYIRQNILPRFAEVDREGLLRQVKQARKTNIDLDRELNLLLETSGKGRLDRQMFTALPHAAAREVLASWLQQNASTELSRQLLERLVVAAKTGRNDSRVDVDGKFWLVIGQDHLTLAIK